MISTAPTVTPTRLPGPSEDDHRVHGDQQDEVEVRREHGALDGREDRPGDARDARAHREPHQLQAAHGHRHQLCSELVLAKRPPGAAGARLIQEVEEGDDDHEGDEGDVEVAVERGDLLPEELKGVEIRDPVRSARPGRVDEDDQPELEEEKGHDRQVVADETPRGKPDQEAGDSGGDGDERYRDRGIPVAARVLGGERGVQVGADPEEGDEAEVEQTDPTDRDVQAEREQTKIRVSTPTCMR